MSEYQVAAYYFPQYHRDPRNDVWHGPGWTEWELLKRATPRFPRHQQPKAPLWGYEDESDPEVAARKIDAAADHAVDALIFDWYWYEDGAFLNRCLENGFMRAKNMERIKFGLMWANHDWLDIHPWKRSTPPHTLLKGQVSPPAFNAATQYIIEHYFTHPSYWRVDGGLYFSIYELMRLVQGLGGIHATRAALDDFRQRTRAAGLGEVHLNAVVWGVQILPGETTIRDPNEMVERLGFDSVTSYVWVHHTRFDTFPEVDYVRYAQSAMADWPKFGEQFKLPYWPNVTMGWDSSPRTVQSDGFQDVGYPLTSVLVENTPVAFRAVLQRAKIFLDRRPNQLKILTLNAWNEWTEGSYLEPDTINGLAYLEAIGAVFRGARD